MLVTNDDYLQVGVALHVSAWIEINVLAKAGLGGIGRTPCECVD